MHNEMEMRDSFRQDNPPVVWNEKVERVFAFEPPARLLRKIEESLASLDMTGFTPSLVQQYVSTVYKKYLELRDKKFRKFVRGARYSIRESEEDVTLTRHGKEVSRGEIQRLVAMFEAAQK